MPEVATAQASRKPRLVPVVVNKPSNVQISYGRAPNGAFDGAKMLMLSAGANLVPEEIWGECRKQSMVKRLLETKIEGTGAPEDAGARIGEFILKAGNPLDADNPLLGLADEDALRFVELTESLSLLKSLSQQQTTATVARAILEKVRRLEAPEHQARKK